MDKEQTAIMRLQEASKMSLQIYEKPLIVTASGGKDSSVCVELARRAGIPFDVSHSHTTADAPETVYFVRSEFKRLEDGGIKCTVEMPTYRGKHISMWQLIPIQGFPPNRFMRYCCSVLKETAHKESFIVTGVRWSESEKRKNRAVYEIYSRKRDDKIFLNSDNDEKRQLFETCQLKAKRIVNPIIDWTDNDVWDFLNSEKIPVNPIYSEGWCRVGCVGCPLAGSKMRAKEFARWPKYKQMYIRAFERMLEVRKQRGITAYGWKTGEEVYHWWIEDGVLPGQIGFDDLESEVEDDGLL